MISLLSLTLISCTGIPEKKVRSEIGMGTVMTTTLYEQGKSEEHLNQISDIVNHLEKDMLSYRLESSEVYCINHTEEELCHVSDDLYEILWECQKIAKLCDGAFDITLGSLTSLWQIDLYANQTVALIEEDNAFHVPDNAQIYEALKKSGYKELQVSDGTIRKLGDVTLDLGAVGKGVALDAIQKYLKETPDISAAVIAAGGSILTYGQKPDKSPWQIGIVNPDDTSKSIGYLNITGEAYVATSGDYERFVEYEGKKYHHILDGKSGYPAESNVKSVTILLDNTKLSDNLSEHAGLLSDALSTACFVLGSEEGMRLVMQYPAQALIVDTDGNILMTTGMEQYFHLSDN